MLTRGIIDGYNRPTENESYRDDVEGQSVSYEKPPTLEETIGENLANNKNPGNNEVTEMFKFGKQELMQMCTS